MHFLPALFTLLSIPFLCLAQTSPAADTPSVEIKQTLSLFSILLDTHQYSQLGQVFDSQATANFSLPGSTDLKGLPAIEQELSLLSSVASQHHLTTQFVNLTGVSTAHATAYLLAVFLGSGSQAGQTLQNFGRYETDWTLTTAGWRISDLTLFDFYTTGDLVLGAS